MERDILSLQGRAVKRNATRRGCSPILAAKAYTQTSGLLAFHVEIFLDQAIHRTA